MNRVLAVHIEGIGLDALEGTQGQSGGIMWCTDASVVPAGTGGFDWRPFLSADSIEGSPTYTSFTSKASTASRFAPIDFDLEGHDGPAELLLYQERVPAARLQSAIAKGDTSIDIGVAGLSGQAVYLHEETIYLDSETATGVYSVTRAYYGSRARAHSTNTLVYDKPPKWKQRGVTLYTYDADTGRLEERQRGRIGEENEQNQTRVQVSGEQLLGGLKRNPIKLQTAGQLRLNRDPNIIDSGSYRAVVRRRSRPGPFYLRGSVQTDTLSRVRKSIVGSGPLYQARDSIFALNSGGNFLPTIEVLGSASGDNADFEISGRRAQSLDVSLYELFVVDRETDEALVAAGSNRISSTAALASVSATVGSVDIEDASILPYHILGVIFSMLLSTRSTTEDPDSFDILQAPYWGADLGYLFADDIAERVHEAIQETQSDFYLVDQVVLGWSGEEVDVLEQVDEVLFSYGFRLVPDKNGALTITRFKLPGPADYTAALANRLTPIDGEVRQADGQSSATDVIAARVGELPFRKGRNIFQRAVDGDAERDSLTIADPDTELVLPTVKVENSQKAIDLVLARALASQVPMPRVDLPVNDWVFEGTDLGMGAPCSIGAIHFDKDWLVDLFGNRISPAAANTSLIGYIMGTDPDHHSGRHVVTVMLTGALIIRQRAPSGIIQTYTDNGDNTATIDLGAASRFGAPTVDASYFNVGDEIRVLDASWALHEAQYPTITAIGAQTIDIDATFTSAPSAGFRVELAPLDSDGSGIGYENDTLNSDLDLVYFFLGDDDETLGDAGLAAHVIGL